MVFDGKVGINAAHIKRNAANAKGLATLAKETPEDLLISYKALGMLPPSATTKDALSLKKERVNYELERIRERNEALRYKRLHPLSEPTDATRDNIASICKGKKPEEILELLDIKTQILPGGQKELSEYAWKPYNYSFKSVGIDENQLLKGVESISGVCNLSASSLKSLGSVKSVGELILPTFTSIEDLSGLKYVGKIKVNNIHNRGEVLDIMKKLKLDPEVLKRACIQLF